MIKLPCTLALLMVVAINTFAVAGDTVEIRVLVDETATADAKQPAAAAMPVEPPKDAKLLLSIEALAGADGEVRAKCVVDGKTIRMKGRVSPVRDGKRTVGIEFSQQGPAGTQQVKTTVELTADEQRVIGGMAGSDGTRLVVLRIKAEDAPANRKAE